MLTSESINFISYMNYQMEKSSFIGRTKEIKTMQQSKLKPTVQSLLNGQAQHCSSRLFFLKGIERFKIILIPHFLLKSENTQVII